MTIKNKFFSKVIFNFNFGKMKNYSEAIKIKHNMFVCLFFFNEILAVDNLLINEHAPAEHQDGWNGRLSTRVTLAAYTHIIKDRICIL